MTVDIARVLELIDLVADERIDELEIVEAGVEYRIARQVPGAAPEPQDAAAAGAAGGVAAGAESDAAPPVAAPHPGQAGRRHEIAAPMAGTFYRTPGADAQPLVEVGAQVPAGAPLCIVEAMKIMNEVTSDQAGTITQVLVENGQMVEQGQALFVMELGD